MWLLAAIAAFAFQPDTAMLRRVYEEALARRQKEYGAADARTAQAARDLGLFLERAGDKAGARRSLAEAVRMDGRALGENAAQTLEDVAALAFVSPPAEAEPLLRRVAESPDPTVAGPALSTLAQMRRAAGDRAGAAKYLRRAIEKAEAIEGRDGQTVVLLLKLLGQLVEPAEGVALFERALAIDRNVLGATHPKTLADVRSLADLLRRIGRPADAAALESGYKSGAAR
jgi:tetratricopeptide (TPR) repeat protein